VVSNEIEIAGRHHELEIDLAGIAYRNRELDGGRSKQAGCVRR
jgi:hypothetical protein